MGNSCSIYPQDEQKLNGLFSEILSTDTVENVESIITQIENLCKENTSNFSYILNNQDSIKNCIDGFIMLNGLKENDIQRITTKYNTFIGIVRSALTDNDFKYFEQDISKSEDEQTITDRQDNKQSYLSGSFYNYSEYSDYIRYIDTELNDLLIKYQDKDSTNNNIDRGVYSSDALNKAILNKWLTLANKLNDEFIQNWLSLYDDDFSNLFQSSFEIKDKKPIVTSKTLNNFINALNSPKVKSNLLQNKNAKFIYTLLTKFDSSVKLIYNSGIKIPSSQFNQISVDKKYKYLVKNNMASGWHAEEDYDDFKEIADIIPRAISTIPVYQIYDLEGDKISNAETVDYIKLDFAKTIDSFSLLSKLLYFNDVDGLNQELDELSVKSSIEKYTDSADYVYNNYFKKLDKTNKTFEELLLTLSEDRTLLLPILLDILFNSDITAVLRAYLYNNYRTQFNYLYSIYKGVYDLDNPSSFISLETVERTNANFNPFEEFIGITNSINQVLHSTTQQTYSRYVYDQDKGVNVREDLESNHGTYEENAFVRRLEGMHRANNPCLNLEQFLDIDLKNIKQPIKLEHSLGEDFELYLVPELDEGQLIFQLKSGKHDILFDSNGNIITPGKSKSDINKYSNFIEPGGLIYNHIQQILPITLNDAFKSQLNNSNLRNSLLQLALTVLGRKLTNEIINIPSITDHQFDESELASVLVDGSKFKSKKAIKIGNFRCSDVKPRKYDFQIELIDKKHAYLIKPIVELNLASNGQVVSSMVADSAKKQLNTNKLAQQGNKTFEGTYDQRKLVTNPNSHLMLYSCYKGGSVIRDYKTSNGEVVEVNDMNAGEHLSANFITDYLGGFNKDIHTIGIAGAVVSDKPYIYRILADIDKKLNYTLDQGHLEKSDFADLTLRKILSDDNSTQLIQELELHELGKYYEKQYDFVQKQIDLINEKLKDTNYRQALSQFLRDKYKVYLNQFQNGEWINLEGLEFNILDNFKSFNEATTKPVLGQVDKKLSKRIRQDIIHHLCRHIPELCFIDNLVGYYNKDGELQANPLLIDLNLRYKSNHANTILTSLSQEFREKYWKNVISVDAYSQQYFEECKSQIVSDILKSNYFLNGLKDSQFITKDDKKDQQDDKKDKSGKKAGDKIPGFMKNEFVNSDTGSIALGKITWNGGKKKLSNGVVFRSIEPYKEFKELAQYDDKTINEELNVKQASIDSSDFDIATTIQVLNSENFLKYRKAITDAKTNLYQLVEQGNLKTIEDFIKNEYATKDEVEKLKDRYKHYNSDAKINEKVLKKLQTKPTASYIKSLKNKVKSNEITSLNVKIEYNKLVTDYNQISLLLNEEHLNVTVGTYLNHPIKGKNLREITRNCIGAQVKRNVTFSATKHQYLYNTLNGISREIDIAIIDNLEDSVYNLVGDGISKDSVQQQLTDDGAIYVAGPMNYLENNSLESSAVGVDKKQFGGFVNPASGTGNILKCAGFAFTQDRLRASRIRQILYKKMINIPWLTNGEQFAGKNYVDFTRDYKGRKIDFAKLNIVHCKTSVDEKTGEVIENYYKITNVRIADDGNCYITKQQVDKFNNKIGLEKESDGILINSNYDLWQHVLGGMHACHLTLVNGTPQYTYKNCDKSNQDLAKLMCLVGELRDQSSGKYYASDDKLNSQSTKKLHTQSTIRQILKEKMIAYAVTDGAFKQGAANRNTIEQTLDENTPLATMKMLTSDLGVQLNAEHTVEEQAIALMTQVINAAAARGYSLKQGNEIYDALYKLTRLAIADCFEGFNDFYEGEDKKDKRNKAFDKLADIILESLKKTSASDSNLLQVLSNNIRQLSNSDNKANFLRKNLPIEDPQILRKIISNIAVSFQKSSVKFRFPGNQLVLVPSNGQMLLYNGRTLDDYGGNYEAMQKHLLSLQETNRQLYPANGITDSADLILGRTYEYQKDGEWIQVKLDNPWVYWQLKEEINKGTKFLEYLPKGYDLGAANCKFDGSWVINSKNGTIGKKRFQIWDLLSVREKWNFEIDLQNKLKAEKTDEGKKRVLNENEAKRRAYQDAIQKDLQILGDNNDGDKIKVCSGVDQKGNLLSTEITIDRRSIENIPYDQILPKTFKDKFGLNEEDSLYKIKQDRNFFLKRALQKVAKCQEVDLKYDIALIGANYNTYFRYSKNIESVTDYYDNYNELDINDHCKNINGKWYRIDPESGNKMYQIPHVDVQSGNNITISKPNIRIFKNIHDNSEIIVTNDLNHFINQNNHIYIDYNSYEKQNVKALKEHLSKSKKQSIQKFFQTLDESKYENIIKQYRDDITNLLKSNDDSKIEPNNYSKLLNNLIRHSNNMRGSFIDSLDCIASRTPAQCHQSFMTTRTVAFDTSEHNSAYVSRWQLWLQGSDFDIDKVNIITYNIKNGNLQKWSPYQRYYLGEGYIKHANKLPLPSGQELVFNDKAKQKLSDIPEFKNLVNFLKSTQDINQSIKALKQNSEDKKTDNAQQVSAFGAILNAAFIKSNKSVEDFANYDLIKQYLISIPSINSYLQQFYPNLFTELDIKSEIEKILKDDYVLEILEDPTSSEDFIYMLNELMQKLDGINEFKSEAFGDLENNIIKYINKHNLYLKDLSVDQQKEILQNFISRRIQQISINPINWIQGQAPIDTITGPWQELAELSKQARESARFVNRSIISTFQQLILTLEGKANVGIVANSLKVFEALSHHIYNTLAYGTIEDIKQLQSDLKIHGKVRELAANAWCNTQKMEELKNQDQVVYNALKAVNQNLDAFTELSVLLSLAVDNAKNPTLSKINGSKKMIGLYTAGVTLGLDKETLIEIINSDTGILINSLLQGNRFSTSDNPMKNIRDVLSYLRKNPFNTTHENLYAKAYLELSKCGFTQLISDQLGSLYGDYTLNKYGKEVGRILNNFVKFVEDSAENKPAKFIEPDEIDKNKELSDLSKDLKGNLKNLIHNLKTNGNKITNIKLIKDFARELNTYHNYLYQISNDTYFTYEKQKDKDGNDVYQEINGVPTNIPAYAYRKNLYLEDISKLLKVNEECQIISFFTKLNQGYNTTIEEQLEFIVKFQNILSDHYEYVKADVKNSQNVSNVLNILNTINKEIFGKDSKYFISFDGYIHDKMIPISTITDDSNTIPNDIKIGENISYKKLIAKAYEVTKVMYNPFKIIEGVHHYKGYLEGMYTTYKSGVIASNIYEAVIHNASSLFKQLNIYKKAQKEEVIKKMIKFFQMQNTTKFFESQFFEGFSFKAPVSFIKSNTSDNIHEFSLGTELGRKHFKSLIENKVLKDLQERYPNNIFIQSLYSEKTDQSRDHNPITIIKTSISTIFKNPIEEYRYRYAKQQLYDLQYEYYQGVNVISLLFLYNLIATDGLQIPGSIGPFFEEILGDRSNSVINAYVDFIKDCGEKGDNAHFNMELLKDALEDYCAPVVSHWTKNVKYNKVYVKNPDTKKVVLLKKVKIKDETDDQQQQGQILDQIGSTPDVKDPIQTFIDNNMTQTYNYVRKGVSKPKEKIIKSTKGDKTKINFPKNSNTIGISSISYKVNSQPKNGFVVDININGDTIKVGLKLSDDFEKTNPKREQIKNNIQENKENIQDCLQQIYNLEETAVDTDEAKKLYNKLYSYLLNSKESLKNKLSC